MTGGKSGSRSDARNPLEPAPGFADILAVALGAYDEDFLSTLHFAVAAAATLRPRVIVNGEEMVMAADIS